MNACMPAMHVVSFKLASFIALYIDHKLTV